MTGNIKCRLCREPADDRLHNSPFGSHRLCVGHGNELQRALADRLAGSTEPKPIMTAIAVSVRYRERTE